MKYYILLGIAVIVFFIVQSYLSNKRAILALRTMIEGQWGKTPGREYTHDEFNKITHYYEVIRNKNKNSEFIDDITWNDLDLDRVFMMLNTTFSSVGEEYLYYLLRSPLKSNEELKERDRLIDYFYGNKNIAFQLQEILARIGRTKSLAFHDYIYGLKGLDKRSNGKHYLLSSLLVLSIGALFFIPQYAIFTTIVMIVVNILVYYRTKAQIESYFICFKYLVGIIINAEKILELNIKELEPYNSVLRRNCKTLSKIKKGVSLLVSGSMTGSLGDIIMDYIRMLFHVDIIKFNSMHAKTINNTDTIDEIYEILGKIESMIAVASFRQSKTSFCKPALSDSPNTHIYFKEMYHPLIDEPVTNSLNETKGVLLTGSNASGKSTFLKTVAINSVLAQTVYTCLADEYNANFFSIYSSMALRDDLESNESYYIVEIKSLKRILDQIGSGKRILCFIDEVLRGTNTVERIAASSQILKSLARKDVLCFAATHDIELTHMLENHYANYHFQEEVLENDINFNYHLYKGRAASRNAIKLLSIMGYDEPIIKAAESSAKRFMEEGVWIT